MEKKIIKIGDLVSVNFNNAQLTLSHEAEVLYIPNATGDSWIFRCIRDDKLHYVNEPCTITLLPYKTVIEADKNTYAFIENIENGLYDNEIKFITTCATKEEATNQAFNKFGSVCYEWDCVRIGILP